MVSKAHFYRLKKKWKAMWDEISKTGSHDPYIDNDCMLCKIADSTTVADDASTCINCPVIYDYLPKGEVEYKCHSRQSRLETFLYSPTPKKAAEVILEKTKWYSYKEWVALVKSNMPRNYKK